MPLGAWYFNNTVYENIDDRRIKFDFIDDKESFQKSYLSTKHP